ncbi:MAG: hypothetical protein AVDCRST_MAG14-298 [uncultured Rubrobacteraceae bacterium]|uniref:Uncharacterized protein n=1 Tax=uncultured Rubrobacteraceae bacterium TaxID=349277 RepID=A0A6J4QIW4_9ACTN|nr:MAG: hypothetical protein AVDCRST_MAG14-298 [uncultured Rubrobacteraceae bacterium]
MTSIAVRTPATVWILTLLMGLMAFVCIVGSFLFAFPMGGLLGYLVGTLLIVAGIGYATIAWRLRRGERAVWIAALVLPIVHTLGLNTLDLVLHGAIPSEDYPFMGVALAIVVLLLLPHTRRFLMQ